MKITVRVVSAVLCLLAAAQGRAAPAQENQIESVSVQTAGKFTKVIIQSTKPLKYRQVPQDMGVTLYFLQPTMARKPAVEKTYSDLVEEIRYAYKGGKSPAPGGAPQVLEYITVKFKEPAIASVVQKEWLVAIELRPKGIGDVQGTAQAPLPTPSGGKKAGKGLSASAGLADVLAVGLANHVPLQLAQDEYKLAGMRYTEAMRNLLPSMTGKWGDSKGELEFDPVTSTDNVSFRRKEVGVEFGIPVFYSGRNFYAFRQAGFERRAADQNVIKTRAELSFEIRRAYHNLIRTQRAIKVRRELHQRAEKLIEVARKKRQLGVITQAEALAAESLFSQTYYRLLSDEKEWEIARLKLGALLNVTEPLPEIFAEPKNPVTSRNLLELGMPPESLIQMALGHRPEMLVAEYNAAAQTFAAKAAKASNLLRVDASYFTGRAGGAYEDDPLKLRHSWNAGLQASMYFLGSTVKGARTREDTVPDFGESSASEIDGKTASIGIFDSLKSGIESRQARINRDRALYERAQARRNVEIDVREAYYNIQKAKIQVKGAQTEFDYRDKELDIARQKERMNLLEPAQSLAAESAYGDAVSNYEEALAFYQVSLASLEKAVGVPLESIPEFR